MIATMACKGRLQAFLLQRLTKTTRTAGLVVELEQLVELPAPLRIICAGNVEILRSTFRPPAQCLGEQLLQPLHLRPRPT